MLAAIAAPRAADPPVPARSGLDYATPGLREMQTDDAANPGMLWVASGRAMWNEQQGQAGKSCANCHGEIATVAGAAYPRRDRDGIALINLEGRIERCRVEQMQAPPLGYDSEGLLALTAAVRNAVRGKVAPVIDDRDAIAGGEAYYRQPRGRLDLSCADCHDKFVGRRLRDETISQGQSNGFPAYRVRWRSLGSLHRRFQVCNQAVGAESSVPGAQDYIALEWYLAWRGRTLPVESPAVRQ
jgi:sulfur-oxidizing protein SoxA